MKSTLKLDQSFLVDRKEAELPPAVLNKTSKPDSSFTKLIQAWKYSTPSFRLKSEATSEARSLQRALFI